MSTTRFWLRPLDTLYFGPPNAMPAGEVNNGRSLFPPPIMALQGMVRTRLLARAAPALNLSDRTPETRRAIEGLVGPPEQLPAGWQLEGPLPMRLIAEDGDVCAQPWVPAPRFLLQPDSERVTGATPPLPAAAFEGPETRATAHPGRNDLTTGLADGTPLTLGLPRSSRAKPRPLSGWLSADNLWRALNGERFWDALNGEGRWDEKGYDAALPPFVRYEHKAGVEIDPKLGAAKDQRLFFLEVLRFAPDAGLAAWLDASLPPRLSAQSLLEGVGRAGRAGRMVAFEPLPPFCSSWQKLWRGDHLTVAALERSSRDKHTFAWLVALTPTRIDDPQRPDLSAIKPPGITLSVRGAILDKPLVIGGYKISEHRSRPNRAYIPGGSAWLLELSGGSLDARLDVLRRLHAVHPLGPREEARFGFGLTVVGLAPTLWRNA
jgi:CRISPR-associated protein Cmr3